MVSEHFHTPDACLHQIMLTHTRYVLYFQAIINVLVKMQLEINNKCTLLVKGYRVILTTFMYQTMVFLS